MKYFFRNQSAMFKEHLQELKSLPLSFTQEKLREIPQRKIQLCVSSSSSVDIHHHQFEFLFRYQIFPSHLLHFCGEWELSNREMQVGDIIVQQIMIPPSRISLKCIFGVKVLAVYHETDRVGFSYGTLKGHPETGINEFSFYQDGSNLMAQICTTAKPGLFISRMLAPFFTRPYVNYCNRQALELMKKTFLGT